MYVCVCVCVIEYWKEALSAASGRQQRWTELFEEMNMNVWQRQHCTLPLAEQLVFVLRAFALLSASAPQRFSFSALQLLSASASQYALCCCCFADDIAILCFVFPFRFAFLFPLGPNELAGYWQVEDSSIQIGWGRPSEEKLPDIWHRNVFRVETTSARSRRRRQKTAQQHTTNSKAIPWLPG